MDNVHCIKNKKGAGNKRDKPDSMLHPAGRIRERTRRSCISMCGELNGVRSAITSCGCELTVSPVKHCSIPDLWNDPPGVT